MFPVTSRIDHVLPLVSVLRGALSFKKCSAVLCLSLMELREYTLYYTFMFNFWFNFHLGLLIIACPFFFFLFTSCFVDFFLFIMKS